jgi:hypothetical protein
VSGAKEGGAEGDGVRADPERGGLGGHPGPLKSWGPTFNSMCNNNS